MLTCSSASYQMLTLCASQWISEVLHFCSGLPIILVGCKKDLRYDQKTIEELHKTSQKPVTPEQVRPSRSACSDRFCHQEVYRDADTLAFRPRTSARRSAPRSTSNAPPRRTKVSVRYLSTRPALHCSRGRTTAAGSGRSASSCNLPTDRRHPVSVCYAVGHSSPALLRAQRAREQQTSSR